MIRYRSTFFKSYLCSLGFQYSHWGQETGKPYTQKKWLTHSGWQAHSRRNTANQCAVEAEVECRCCLLCSFSQCADWTWELTGQHAAQLSTAAMGTEPTLTADYKLPVQRAHTHTHTHTHWLANIQYNQLHICTVHVLRMHRRSTHLKCHRRQ